MKEKNLSIEFLKFIAVIAVANHWMVPLYGKYGFLATGGAIGDGLFFFASGFTIFMGRLGRFDNWYKRRIRRIFPSVIAVSAFMSFTNISQLTLCETLTGGGHWFIKCIMIYYVLLFFVRKYSESRPLYPFLLYCIIVITWYYFEDKATLFMYGDTYFRWACFFVFMLFGAYMGRVEQVKPPKVYITLIGLLFCLVFFYALLILAKRYESVAKFQVISLLPLIGIVFFIYKFSCTAFIKEMIKSKIGLLFRFVAGLCLEIYLVSNMVIEYMEGKMMELFPLNLLITFIMIVGVAYLARCLSRIFIQIFEKDDFDWKSVFKLI